MSEYGLSEAVTYILVWIAHPGACRKCLALHGYTWTLQRLDGILDHPLFGAVYDLTNELELTHPYGHCSIDVVELQVDLERIFIA